MHIFGEWIARTKSHRYIVIGPDWACVAMTYTVIIIPSVFVSIYFLVNLAETIIYFVLFGLCIFGLTTVFIADPGLVRKYHHARSRHWTYWWVRSHCLACWCFMTWLFIIIGTGHYLFYRDLHQIPPPIGTCFLSLSFADWFFFVFFIRLNALHIALRTVWVYPIRWYTHSPLTIMIIRVIDMLIYWKRNQVS